MTTTSATEATVTTMTAEVRTLAVGARQITLSVARQLDWFEWHQLNPMGRVRLGMKDTPEETVIGRHTATGALANAEIPPLWQRTPTEVPDLPAPATPLFTVCSNYRHERRRAGELTEGIEQVHGRDPHWVVIAPCGEKVWLRSPDAVRHLDHLAVCKESCVPTAAEQMVVRPEVGDYLDRLVWAEFLWRDTRAANIAQLRALPLIVLAGLR